MRKRILSLLLALCLFCSLLPVTAFAAPSIQPVYVAFTSDVHSKTTDASDSGHSPYRLNNWITKVSNTVGAVFDTMVFCGDSADGTGAANGDDFWNKVQTVMNVARDNNNLKGNGLFLAGNHEWENGKLGNSNTTHAAAKNIQSVGTKVVTDNYVLYLFGASSSDQNGTGFKTVDITALDKYLSSAPADRPIFITSHFPIHTYSSRSTANASTLIDTLNKYGDKLDLYFIWGHNHSQSDGNYDKFFDDDDKLLNKSINFVYCAAGCMSDSEYVGSSSVKGKGMVAKIVGGKVESLTYYGKDNKALGSYNPVYTQTPQEPEKDYIASGKCGDNLTWTLYKGGMLTISGTGAMYDAGPYDWVDYREIIKSVEIEDGVTSIGNVAFYNHSSLESVEIPNSVTNIGARAFHNCTGLTSVKLPEGLKKIESELFNSCSNLINIEIPDSVTSIGDAAFYGCRSLTDIEIPAGVKKIGMSTFNSCTNLKSIIFTGNAPEIGENAFAFVTATVSYPGGDATWTNAVKQHYGGTITWVEVCPGHKWSAATCTTPKTCSVCGATEGAAKGHNHTAKVTEPTCTERGYTTYTCACGDTYRGNETPATGHNYTPKVTAPTCTQQGYTTYICSCGDSYIDNYVNATGHSYTSKVTAPTCTEKGYTTYTCHCGHSYEGDYVDETGHSYTAKVTKPTCTEDGYTTYTCHCGHSYKDNYVNKTGHSYTSVVTEPTCTAGGYTTNTCACGDSNVSNRVNSLGHNWGAWQIDKEATCAQEGAQHRDCSRCDEQETQAIKKLDHKYTTVVTAPTCTEQGYTTYTCGTCGDTYIANEKEALDHDEVIDKGYAATCTKEGLTDGVHCGRCNTVLTQQKTLSALGHSWDEGKVTTEPTEDKTGIRTYTCETCSDTMTEEIPVLGHTHSYTAKVTEPSCTEGGYSTYTCACGDSYVSDRVNALGHNWGAWVTDKEATCTEEGIQHRECSRCEAEEAQAIEKLNHQYTTVVTAPTCTEKGYTTYTCACGDSYVADYVDATGHAYEEGVCGNCGAADPDYQPVEEQFDIDSANMTLGNNLAMNFYVDPDYIDADEDYYAEITKTYADGRDDVVVLIDDEDWNVDSSDGFYYFTLNQVAAKEMADAVYVVIYRDEAEDVAVSEVWEDSVRAYAERALKKEEGKPAPDADKLALYVDLLNYGAEAQIYFDYNVDDLANKNLTAEQLAYGQDEVTMTNDSVRGTGYAGMDLVLKSEIILDFYFTNIPDDHAGMYAIATYENHYGEEKQIRVEGEAFLQDPSDGCWYVPVKGLVVADCMQMVTIQIYNADGTVIGSAVDSVESYIARIADASPLYVAIMKFAVSAYNSFH